MSADLTLADLAARLQRLEDEHDITALLYEVAYVVDGPEEAAWLNVFTPEGQFTWARAEGAERALDVKGHKALADWFAGHRKSNLLGTQLHIVLHPLITLDGDKAQAKTVYVTQRLIGGVLVSFSNGTYDDKLVRCADGKWRLAEHHSFGNMSHQPAAK